MSNRLIHAASPYLRQHAHNPVDWFPWGGEAFTKARAESKPIFLSIGYSTCHWCHVMERESFENETIASLLNAHFVAIKVDREERPDLDRLYMAAVQAFTGNGGWPMSVWLTPDRQPFHAGTYFPPDIFQQILQRIHEIWTTRSGDVFSQAARVTEAVQQQMTVTGQKSADDTACRLALAQLNEEYDAVNGGFGHAPKFPHPVTLNFLFRSGDAHAKSMALHQLRAMAEGGIHDQLAGGFHRYSVDERWGIPHFEKMLYDQALLISSYVDAWQITKEPFYRDIARRTADYVLRDLTSPEGDFYSAEDADSEGVEGKFYVWTRTEIEEVLGPRSEDFCRVHGDEILHGIIPAQERAALLSARNRRIRPHRDDKILTAWNGLMISALARLGDLASAQRATQYLLANQYKDRALLRTPSIPGMLEDYAFFATGLLDLYENDLDPEWLQCAIALADTMLEKLRFLPNRRTRRQPAVPFKGRLRWSRAEWELGGNPPVSSSGRCHR